MYLKYSQTLFFNKDFLRFLIIGGISTLVNYSVFSLIFLLGIDYHIASGGGYISGLILGFFLNKTLNFYTGNKHNIVLKYLSVYGINLCFSLLFLHLYVDVLGGNVYIGNIGVIVYSTLANYIGLKKYVFFENTLLCIAVGGNSGSGKTFLVKNIIEVLGRKNVALIKGDSYHKYERGDKHLKKISPLHPHANFLTQMKGDISNIANGASAIMRYYDHSVGKFTFSHTIKKNNFIVYDGLHGLYGSVADCFDIKIFIESDICEENKFVRDITERNRKMKALNKDIERRRKEYKKYILPQKKNANIILSYQFKNSKIELFLCPTLISKSIKKAIQHTLPIQWKKNTIIIDTLNTKEFQKYIPEWRSPLLGYNGIITFILVSVLKDYANHHTNGLNRRKV